MNLHKKRVCLVLLLLLGPASSLPQAAPAAPVQRPAGGASVLPPDVLGSLQLGGTRPADALITRVEVEGPGFTTALRAQTLVKPEHPYQLQLSARNSGAIVKDDVLLASFWMRTVESPMEEGFIGFTFEKATPDYRRSFGYETSTGTAWKLFQFPFKSAESYGPGEAALNLRLGYSPQTIELAGVSLLNYGKSVSVDQLPATRLTYAGIEEDAPWRAAARERIEKLRKAELKVRVLDGAGNPVPGARVQIKQTRSAFPFGSAVNARALLSEAPEDRKYREMVATLFNRVVFENDLKWDNWRQDRNTPQRALEWLRAQNIETRGHVMVWPSWRRSPGYLKKLEGGNEAVRRAISEHIRDIGSTLQGQLVDWDVLNEPYRHNDFLQMLGPAVQVDWFRAARQADAGANLYLNDYGILEAGGKDFAHQQHFEDTIRLLLREKAPLNGIGIQGHFGSDLTPPVRMLEILDRFAAFGLPIQITEFDVQVPSEALQAAFTRDFLTAMFSHPAVNGVVMWGFWEGRHYAPGAALWRKDWTIKPNGRAWMDLVHKEWRTNLAAPTDAHGNLATRAFLGDYEVQVTSGNTPVVQTVKLPKAGETVEVVVRLAGEGFAGEAPHPPNPLFTFHFSPAKPNPSPAKPPPPNTSPCLRRAVGCSRFGPGDS